VKRILAVALPSVVCTCTGIVTWRAQRAGFEIADASPCCRHRSI
jgi:hypothetical protein